MSRGPRPPGWTNWAGNQSARPVRVTAPRDATEAAEVVRRAVDDGLPVRAVGTGHSFTPLVATDGVLVRPDAMTGVHMIDRERGTVTVAAGTPLRVLVDALDRAGVALANLGDVTVQTVAGAVSTGTHGTGRGVTSLSAQVVGVELVLADGSVHRCDRDTEPELFAAARLGLGAVGLLTAVTFAVVPAFLLHAVEEPRPLATVLADLPALADENDHVEFYWFPGTQQTLTKVNNRVGPDRDREPLGRVSAWVDDELLSNGVFDLVCRLQRRLPTTVSWTNQAAGRALSRREYVESSYRVFSSPRRVRFVEQEYAVPRAAVGDLLDGVRAAAARHGIGFPVEVRVAPADEVWLSPAHGRSSAYVAVHAYRGTPFAGYFAEVERVALALGGRPHWGKLHTRDAAWCAQNLPCFERFRAVRERVDPGRVFANRHLRHVLGP